MSIVYAQGGGGRMSQAELDERCIREGYIRWDPDEGCVEAGGIGLMSRWQFLDRAMERIQLKVYAIDKRAQAELRLRIMEERYEEIEVAAIKHNVTKEVSEKIAEALDNANSQGAIIAIDVLENPDLATVELQYRMISNALYRYTVEERVRNMAESENIKTAMRTQFGIAQTINEHTYEVINESVRQTERTRLQNQTHQKEK